MNTFRLFIRLIVLIGAMLSVFSCYQFEMWFYPDRHFEELYMTNNADTTILVTYITNRKRYANHQYYPEQGKYDSAYYWTINPNERVNVSDKDVPLSYERWYKLAPHYMVVFKYNESKYGEADVLGIFEITYSDMQNVLNWELCYPFPEEIKCYTIDEWCEKTERTKEEGIYFWF